jgi:hypothetical protein
MDVFVLLSLESEDRQDSSRSDWKTEIDNIGCSVHRSRGAAKEAAQKSFDSSLGDQLEEGEDKQILKWAGIVVESACAITR